MFYQLGLDTALTLASRERAGLMRGTGSVPATECRFSYHR
jgi:hypothetical protein